MKPMLARTLGPKFDSFPCFCQPKLNGVRACYQAGSFQSRDEKLWFPGKLQHLVEELKSLHLPDIILDGELYVHNWRLGDINSAVAVNSKDRTDKTHLIEFHIFDVVDVIRPFSERFFDIYIPILQSSLPHIKVTPTSLIHSREELDLHFHQYTSLGYEGIMLRPDGPYELGEHEGRNGPTQFRSRFLWKHKCWLDDEFECVGITEGEGKAAIGIGALVINTHDSSRTFRVGTGFTDEERIFFMHNPPIGQQVKVRYLELTAEGVPFNPSFLCVIS